MSSTHWNILSSWSKAGVGTSIVLELKKPSSPSSSPSNIDGERRPNPTNGSVSPPPGAKSKNVKSSPRVAFDMGVTPCFDDAIPAKYVFVSHGHVDHVGALFGHARAHAVACGGTAPTYFVPAQLLPQIERCRDAMSLLDATNVHPEGTEGGRRTDSLIKMKLVAVRPGDEIPLKGIHYGSKTSFFVRAFEVDHAGHPALGYVIASRTTSGLKEEYRHLDGKQIRAIVKSGVSIKDEPIEKIEVAYSGDTCARGLMKRPKECDCERATAEEGTATTSASDIGQMFRAELLLCELTFLDSSEDEQQRSKAEERGHLHINDLESIFSSHTQHWDESERSATGDEEPDSNEAKRPLPKNVVFYHLSARYQPAERALDFIAMGLPRQLRDRCHIAISSMLTQEEKLGENPFANLIQPNGCISLVNYTTWKDAPI